MAPARRRRSRISQPELPLPLPATGTPTLRTRARPTADWRLDEHTRRVGRLGIAAARAQLEPAATGDRSRAHDGEPERTGRAA